MWVRRTDLHVVTGELEFRVSDLGEGRQRRRPICPRCETQLWGEPANKPGLAALRTFTLINQHVFSPIAHSFTRSKCPWLLIPDGVPTFENGIADPDLLTRLCLGGN